MAVRVYCNNPHELLESIRTAINTGEVETWKVDSDGDFTHSPTQWAHLAWMRPTIFDDHIAFNILGTKTKKMSKMVYGVYHGRFIEMMLVHFDLQFTRASATALPTSSDFV
ncbi:hypothetical protein AA0229_1613 [Gluconobacter cerinus NRIC 0229]|uniref:Uncharacterized protein n=1 Tax=Gluconobacter cerinus TaxID=38307 RepID=A0AAV5N9F6_9PROT|nr:hypothetical protein AA0229_1613 [Gluconobacter cerinus NRIC 0229]GLQ61256.1 hypothetical protein GCM10007867_01010 [Gluconobacter cerinus]